MSQPCPRKSFIEILLRNTPIVLVVILFGDIIASWIITGSPTALINKDIGWRLLFTLVLSMAYGYLYGRAARIWRDGFLPDGLDNHFIRPFAYEKKLRSSPQSCEATWYKIFNGLIFGAFVCGAFFMVLLIGGLMISTLYIFILDGIRGGFTISTTETIVKTAEILLAGVAMEHAGKTEDDGDATP